MSQELVIERYGIYLQPLQEQDVELIRNWRNDPEIARHMLDQTYITSEMQQKWFAKLQASETDFYFMIHFKVRKIGVASLTCIDCEAGTVEPGMYIYEDKYRGNIVPFCAALALNDLAFEVFGLTRLYGKIFKTNRASIRFHEMTGYKKYAEQQDLWLYSLVWDDYEPAREKVKRFIRY